MKRTEKNEKEKSDNALFVNQRRGRSSNKGNYQARGRSGGVRGARFQNFNPVRKDSSQFHHDDHERYKGTKFFKCNQDGHIAKHSPLNNKHNRRRRRRRENSNMAELESVALISSTMNQSNEWFIDSAATEHMTRNKNILENSVQYQEPRNIYLGDSSVILAHGEGKVGVANGSSKTLGLAKF